MKAYKIDVEGFNVSSIDIDTLADISKSIGNQCWLYTCFLRLNNGDVLFVDDEALLKNVTGCFMIKNYERIVVGNAIILGVNKNDGTLCEPKTDLQKINNQIIWGNKEMANKYKQMLHEDIRCVIYN